MKPKKYTIDFYLYLQAQGGVQNQKKEAIRNQFFIFAWQIQYMGIQKQKYLP